MSKAFTLVYGDERLPYEVSPDPKRTTRIAIHVDPDGRVSVDAPPNFQDEAVRTAVQKRARWVLDEVTKARDRFAHVRPKQYVSGEQVLYLGRRYMLKVLTTDERRLSVRLKGNRLEVQTRTGEAEDVQGRVRGWYRVKARDYFAKRLADVSSRLPWVHDVPPFRLLNMARQWGSCSPSGHVILNPHLIKAPRECVDYVLIHELVHLKHHDHAPEFWSLLDRYSPGWPEYKERLDGLVEVLMAE